MIEQHVILGGRQTGKTYRMMTEIHERIIAGERADILVLAADVHAAKEFFDVWNTRFPQVPMPDYAYLMNLMKLRGRVYKHAYMEYVDQLEEGIYDLRLGYALLSVSVSLTVTSGYGTGISLKSHNAVTDPVTYAQDRIRRIISGRKN